MSNSKMTKRALLTSIMALMLCFAMLTGTTFAWFTDQETSGNNKIIAGNLDIEMYNALATEITDATAPIDATTTLFDGIKFWEPGAAAYENITVVNEGNLALKYQLTVNFEDNGLAEALKVAVVPDGIAAGTTREALIAQISASTTDTWAPIANFSKEGNLYLEDDANTAEVESKTATYGVVIYWEPSDNDNKFNANDKNTAQAAYSVNFGVTLVATQLAAEEDAFNDQYDQPAPMPIIAMGTAAVDLSSNESVYYISATDNEGAKYATANVPKAAIAAGTTAIVMSAQETEVYGEVTVNTNQGAKTFDINFEGLVENNSEPIHVELFIGKNLTNVTLYHYGNLLTDVIYRADTGYVIFDSANFSPFTVVYDAISADIEKPDADGNYPVAIVTDADEWENTKIDWKGFGPVPAYHNADQQLESAYVFEAPHTSDTIDECTYKDWYCDYVVSMSKDVNEGAVFLGGNYGDFGWIGFENPQFVAANEEVYLLGSVTENPWTYEMVVQFVQKFTCGVAHLDDSLEEATFTVRLRLTNPEDESQYIDVNTVDYTFPTVVYTAQELEDAVNGGSNNIQLGGDIDLSQGIVIP